MRDTDGPLAAVHLHLWASASVGLLPDEPQCTTPPSRPHSPNPVESPANLLYHSRGIEPPVFLPYCVCKCH